MIVVFDTNVILDVLLAREPWVREAAILMSEVDRGRVRGLVCATTVTTIHYLAARANGRQDAAAKVESLLEIFEIAPVDRAVLTRAAQSNFADYEDAVIHEAAAAAGAACIVTRNARDFRNARIPVHTPHEMITLLSVTGGLA